MNPKSKPPSFPLPAPEALFLRSESARYTYASLYGYSRVLKERLHASDISTGHPVALLSESSDELVFAIASCWLLGIPYMPLSPNMPKSEFDRRLEAVEPSSLLCDESNIHKTRSIPTILLDGSLQKAASQAATPPARLSNTPPESESVLGYFFTSGTTGPSKTVPLKRRQMLYAARASARNFKPEAGECWLLCMPFNHVGGVSLILRSLLYGSTIYRLSRFDTQKVSHLLSSPSSPVTVASLVPTMLTRLLRHPGFGVHDAFKAVLLGGGPMGKELLESARSRGVPIIPSYGMTETCAQVAANTTLLPGSGQPDYEGAGRLFAPNQIEIRDDSGHRLPAGQTGTIWLKGPQVFDGYRAEGETLEAGWFNTGDFGRLSDNGMLYIETRRSDLIITGGENVSPRKVEAALEDLPGIQEAAAVGMPDAEWGQAVTAVLVSDKEWSLQSLRDALRGTLAAHELPRRVHRVESLPRTATGKLQRHKLGQMIK